MSATYDIKELEGRMRASLDAFKRELQGLRTGRASAHLLDPVQVMVYGSRMPLNQVATVTTPEPRMIAVQVWDRSQRAQRSTRRCAKPISASIRWSTVQLIRLPLPAPTAERRTELVKQAHKYAESHRIAVRNVRRDGLDLLKKLEKDGKMSEDDHKKNAAKVQELTDKLIKEIDQILASKETEIQKV